MSITAEAKGIHRLTGQIGRRDRDLDPGVHRRGGGATSKSVMIVTTAASSGGGGALDLASILALIGVWAVSASVGGRRARA
jgi:hypothetical protein